MLILDDTLYRPSTMNETAKKASFFLPLMCEWSLINFCSLMDVFTSSERFDRCTDGCHGNHGWIQFKTLQVQKCFKKKHTKTMEHSMH